MQLRQVSETPDQAAGRRWGTTPSPTSPQKTPVPTAGAFNQMHQLAMIKAPTSSIGKTTKSLSGHRWQKPGEAQRSSL